MERRADAMKGSSPKLAAGEDNLAVSSTTETEGTELQPLSNPYAKEEEFKFTIDADDEDEELQKIEVEGAAEDEGDKETSEGDKAEISPKKEE